MRLSAEVTRNVIISVVLLLLVSFLVWFALPPGDPFPDDYSRLVFDKNGRLLRITLSEDEQYRFPVSTGPLPDKYVASLVTYEDKRFYLHPGVDPLALVNAFITNLKAGEIVRGGSTITMQLARLANPKSRTYFNKFREILTSFRYSLHYSKTAILRLYAAHVPMGRNIVGIESASYYYLGRPLAEITWAEAAMLVVLPNAPARVNLSRSRDLLIRKRNLLLEKLHVEGLIDADTYGLAIEEPLPASTCRIPFLVPHFSNFVLKNGNSETTFNSTLDLNLQSTAEEICDRHHMQLKNQGIFNLAALVTETRSGKIRAYIGSQSFYDSLQYGQVDGILAYRSTGSLLKPFLVARILDRGPYTLQSRIQDVPTFFGTFVPQNAGKTFSGLVTMEELLIRSLNVPAVRLLNTYGIRDFYDYLSEAGLTGLFRPPEEYGLTLILGGAEASLFELTQLYSTLGNYGRPSALQYLQHPEQQQTEIEKTPLISDGASWLVLDVLTKLKRPGIENYWHVFNNQIPVAWKTGTSYGQKDGWAIGVNQQWTIGVWTGNFDGKGNGSLSGSRSAAPILFDLFNALDTGSDSEWFQEPEYDLTEIPCCVQSGYPAGPDCPESILLKRPLRSHRAGVCPFHRRYVVDKRTGKSVCSLCWQGIDTSWVSHFIVPAGVREILTRKGFTVAAIPEHAAHCPSFKDKNRLEITYPVPGVRILIPRDIDGTYENIVLAAKHQRPETNLFWYLNGTLLGTTINHHELPVTFDPGTYKLTVQDEEGFSRSVSFSTYKVSGR